MRIIAGEFRGRKLLPPETDATRPITDRVKQSLFDILSPRLADAVVYDCFAGTGSMGLECLSREASRGIFFEIDRSAVARLRKNIDALGVQARSTVVTTDLFRVFTGPSTLSPADLIFLDPPYSFLREKPDPLCTLAHQLASRLKPDGVLLFRHDAGDELPLPSLVRSDVRHYGSMTIEFLQAPTPTSPHP